MDRNGSFRPGGQRVCPASLAGWLSTGFRRWLQDPDKILKDYIHPGDVAIDLGCGPGFFTLPLARMTGPGGRVLAVDLQPAMLHKLEQRAERAGLAGSIECRTCQDRSIGLLEAADFVLAFYMVHEVPDVARFLGEVAGILKDGGRFLMAEPNFHVSGVKFRRTVELAQEAGLALLAEPRLFLSRAALFRKGEAPA